MSIKQQGQAKRVFLRVLIVLLLFIAGITVFLLFGQNEIKNMQVADVSISDMKDGVYIGSFEGYRWSNEVQVMIEDGKIASIHLIKDQVVHSSEMTNELFLRVIQNQSLRVDTISGATITSKAYLKAMENALKQ